ncbi:MAG: type I DNA topoisomerase, partial [Firmicutes bacterium]|nr:type I DNA topoisomerase [Bacillota bacterium]
AIKEAVRHPDVIDMDKVEAQQARRILDRLVGYKISPLLWRKVKKGLSAGRVQSVAVRMICDREEEILAFVPEEYWHLYAHLAAGEKELVARLIKVGGKKAAMGSRNDVNKVLAKLDGAAYTVGEIGKKESKKSAPPPFTTSTMQQEASRRLSMTAKKTMQTAQSLYEGVSLGGSSVGLITYMRTDSVRISEAAQAEARQLIAERYGQNYLPARPNQFKGGKGKVQDAHEAIRPTSVLRTPAAVKEYLNPAQYKLYKLIWERFVASQMAPCVLETQTVDISAADCLFRASGTTVLFAGYRQVYAEGKDEANVEDGVIAPVQQGQTLPLKHLDPTQHFTTPPPRYNEASLIKELEEKGIGRPSTYAPIIDTIIARCYVVREEKQLFPTELGTLVVDLLKDHFSNIVDVTFTKDMEEQLDMVEEGQADWVQVLRDFYDPFAVTLAKAEEQMEKVTVAPEESGELCDKCGRPMVYRMSRYGKFLACSGFPECRNTKPIVVPTQVKCLSCGGDIVQRKSRTGRVFYGCANYPECTYVSWEMPIEKRCELCGTQLAQRPFRGGMQETCPKDDCANNKTAYRKSVKTTKSKAAADKPKKSAKAAAEKPAKKTTKTTTKKTTTKKTAKKEA